MTGADAAFWTFVGLAFLFGYLAMREAPRIRSVHAFFHDSRVSRNVLSYTAANITLGTGLAYILSAIGNLGALFLIAPVTMLLGYFALSRFLTTCASEDLFSDNLVKGLSSSIDMALSKKAHFAAVFSVILTVVFALILAFEIFASSKLLSSLMFAAPTVKHEIFAGSAVFMVALLYSLWGGFKAVQTTDQWQLCLIGLLFVALVVIFYNVPAPTEPAAGLSPLIPPITPHLIFATIAAGLAAFTTQFYSILNLCAASQQARTERRTLFVRIGMWTFLFLALLTGGALFISATKGVPFALLNNAILGHVTGATGGDIAYSVVLMLGMASVLFSTVDTIIVSVAQFSYSNIFCRDASDNTDNPVELRRVRIAMLTLGPVVFAVLALAWFCQPTIFGLLLGIVSGNDVLAPLLVLLVLLHKKNLLGNLRGPLGIPLYWLFVLLFLAAVACAVSFSLLRLPYTQYVGPAAFVASSLVAVIIFRRKA